VQRIPPFAQKIERLEPDFQMLRDGRFVKGIRCPRKLDLAMQRLVRNAKQGA